MEPILLSFHKLRANDTALIKEGEKEMFSFLRSPEVISSFLMVITYCDDAVVSFLFFLFLLVSSNGCSFSSEGDYYLLGYAER